MDGLQADPPSLPALAIAPPVLWAEYKNLRHILLSANKLGILFWSDEYTDGWMDGRE